MNMNGPRFVRAAAQGFIPTFTFDCKQEIFRSQLFDGDDNDDGARDKRLLDYFEYIFGV